MLLVLCIFAGFDLDLRVGFGYGLLMIGAACWVVCVVCCSCLVLCSVICVLVLAIACLITLIYS